MGDNSVRLTRFAPRSKRTMWTIIILVTLASVGSMVWFGFNTNLLNLIPEDAKSTRLYLKLIKDFGIMDEAYVVLDGDIASARPAIETFAKELARSPLVKGVEYQLDPAVREFLARTMRQNALLYLDDAGITEALERLRPEQMQRRLTKVKNRLILPSKGLALTDPLGYSELALSRMPAFEMPVEMSSGWFLSNGGSRLLMIIKPAGEARDIAYDRSLIQHIEATFAKHFVKGGPVTLGITGSHAITYHEQAIMKEDIKGNLLTSFVSVAAISIVFLRNLWAMAYTFLPVLVSVFITMGVGTLVFGSMTEVAGAFGAMLVGLGDDLAIVLYVRYLHDLDIDRSVRETSGAIWAGVLTTAAVFLPMVFSDFRGIREFGFLTAVGIVLCGFLVFFLSAPLMRRGKAPDPTHTGLESLIPFAVRHRKTVIIVCLALFAVSLIGFRNVRFTVDLQALGAKDNPSRTLFRTLGIEKGGAIVTGTAASLDEAVARSADVTRELSSKGVNATFSLASFVPDEAQQRRNLERIRQADVEQALRNFRAMAKSEGFTDDHVRVMSDNIRGFFGVTKPIMIGDMKQTGLDAYLGRFYKQEGGQYRFLVMVQEKRDLSGALPKYEVTGSATVKGELSSMLKRNALVITLIGFVLVNVIIYLKFRNVRYAFYAQFPIVLAILLSGAILAWSGIDVHIMNAIVAVMLFGIGTDYAIHLMHGIGQDGDLRSLTRGTGRAITLAAYTTIAGFGSIYFSSYQGLSEMGLAVTLGCTLSLVFTLLLVPVFMHREIAARNGVVDK